MNSFPLIDGSIFPFQIGMPIVRDHFANSSSMINELIHQITVAKIFDRYFPKNGMTFLDLGANIGLVSIYASPRCNRIVAVEPAPSTYELLFRMVSPLHRVETICAAIAPRDGTVEFHVNDVNTTASSTVNTYGQLISVRGMTLSTLLRERNISHVDFCKVDIEGGEGESLSLAEFQNATNIIDSYYIETHNCPATSWEHKLGTIVANLSRCGYHKQEIVGMGIWARKA